LYLGASPAALPCRPRRAKTRDVLHVLLEAFWPSRRLVQFDELCLPAA
jgi:hypothetical protein